MLCRTSTIQTEIHRCRPQNFRSSPKQISRIQPKTANSLPTSFGWNSDSTTPRKPVTSTKFPELTWNDWMFKVTAWLVVYLPIWKILVFRLLKSFRMPFLANIFFMIYLWFEYDFHLWFFYGFKLWLWFFYGLDMIFYDFFNGFLVLRIWFSAKNSRNFRFLYDFARVSFSPKPFQQKIWFWKQNRKKIVKKS